MEQDNRTTEIKSMLQEYKKINEIIVETLIGCELAKIRSNNEQQKIEFIRIQNELTKLSSEVKEHIIETLRNYQ